MSIAYHQITEFDHSKSCPICLELFNNVSEIKNNKVYIHDKDNATHPVHGDCIRQWLKRNLQCPVCRINIDDYSSLFTWKERAIMKLNKALPGMIVTFSPILVSMAGFYLLDKKLDAISSIAFGLLSPLCPISFGNINIKYRLLMAGMVSLPYAGLLLESKDYLSTITTLATSIIYSAGLISSKRLVPFQPIAIATLAGGIFNLNNGVVSGMYGMVRSAVGYAIGSLGMALSILTMIQNENIQ